MARKSTSNAKGIPAKIKTAAVKGVAKGETFATTEKALIAKGEPAKGLYEKIRRAAIDHYGSVEAVRAARAKGAKA
jgi:hypothetical protein